MRVSPGDRPRERDADPPRNRYAILALIVVAQTVANIGPLGIPAIASRFGFVGIGARPLLPRGHARPPVFGAFVEWAGGYRAPWIGLAVVMAGGLLLLGLVREGPPV